MSGDVIGDRGVRGDGLRAYRAACCGSIVSGSCVSGDSGGDLGGGGCAIGMVCGCGIGLKTGCFLLSIFRVEEVEDEVEDGEVEDEVEVGEVEDEEEDEGEDELGV